MKLWLLEILACPIDHAFPLELTIFKWILGKKEQLLNPLGEKGDLDIPKKYFVINSFEELIQRYKEHQPLQNPDLSLVRIEEKEGIVFVSDDLVIKPASPLDYLHQLEVKLDELSVVHDISETAGQQALEILQLSVRDDINNAIAKIEKDTSQSISILNDILHTLEFLNLVKYHMEIEDGVIRCPQCKRWYPIFETIPQMLPDNIRDVEHDTLFQSKWAEKFQF